MNTLLKNLKNNNLKATPQRLVIYSFLSQNPIHPTAEMIYNNIKQDNPTISLATVYKTVKALKEANLIQEINVGEDSFRYDFRTKAHSHIICKKCSCIEDYFPNTSFMDTIKTSVENETKFILDSEQMYFYGVCHKCSNNAT